MEDSYDKLRPMRVVFRKSFPAPQRQQVIGPRCLAHHTLLAQIPAHESDLPETTTIRRTATTRDLERASHR